MHRVIGGAVLLLVFGPALRGQDEPKDKADKPQTAAEEYRALQAELQKAAQEVLKPLREAKEEDRERLIQQYHDKQADFAGRFLEFAQKHPKDKEAFDALTFVISNARPGPEGDKAAELLQGKDYTGRFDARFLMQLSRARSPAAEKVLRDVIQASDNAKLKAQAALSLGQYYKQKAEAKDVPPAQKERLTKQAEEAFTMVTEKFGDADAKVTERAKGELYETHFLAVGMAAPDIEGEDVDGKSFKLSDYRGKVVMLDFWGHW
jgi:hypothetical protein